jgi:hypothetical protein
MSCEVQIRNFITVFKYFTTIEKITTALRTTGPEVYRALFINTARPARTVKLLNGTQNVWASDLSDLKI